jgi:tetratricopeptide (TPR) repeat protein
MVDELVNPYIAGAPVTEARMFFGREDVFDWIQNSLVGKYADHILVIHGQRRVGKTSVLKQLGNRLPQRYIPVFFDLQGRTHTTLDRFLWWLAREIVRVLKQERGVKIPTPEKEAFSADPEYFESHFLASLLPMLDSGSLLLTFDEFDNLEESEIKETLARPLIDYLRRLMGRQGLNFIFSIGSSGRKLENMQADYTDFFKTALYRKISFLNEEQTNNLITRPVQGIIEYDKHSVNRIYRIAGGHPYFTQLTCHELFALCQQTNQRHIRENDVEAILDDVVERGTVNLKFVWDEASDIEKWTLASLARLEKTDNRALTDYLRKQRVRFSESDLASGLFRLREKDILTPENQFVIHLLRLWLQKNRPIEQVREELTEVNPIANRYIEIGLEFKNSGQYQKAIESFEQALAVSTGIIQAQVSIALVYMDQKYYDKAVAEFEKALAIDDEDVTARAGLCEAHLALGDAAMQKGRLREAAQSYQRVLAINEEHTEARQRMAEITRQRAEKALLNGRDEDALSAFTEALRFTPEDPDLVARVEQFRAEKKIKILAILLRGSEKEVLAKNWDGAVRSLEEALTLSPDDETIPKKLADAKAAQAKEGALSAVYAEAQRAYTGKDYDQAVSLFKKIVLEDENYRDASRLLAQAIELRRTAPKWWRRKAPQAAKRIPLPRSKPRVSPKKILTIGAASLLVLGFIAGLFWIAQNGLPAIFIPAADKTPTASPPPTGTPDPRVLNPANQHLYLYVSSERTWHEARNYCALQGGYLATVQTAVENEFLYQLTGGNSNVWLGATDEAEEGVWSWVTGEPWTYKNWAEGEPNNASEEDARGENHMSFLWPEAPSYWNDVPAASAQPFVCEWGPAASDLDPDIHTKLDTIHNKTPIRQMNFEDWEFGDPPENDSLENGKLVLVSENQEHVGLSFDVLPSDSFAVEFEFRVTRSGPGSCFFGADNGDDSDETRKALGIGFDPNNQTHLDHYMYPDQYPGFAEGSYDDTEPNKVTLMVHGGTITVFINGIYTFDVPNPDGNTFYSRHSFSAEGNNACEFYNYRLWNLSEADSSIIQIALDAIQNEAPTYETGFDDWDFGKLPDYAKIDSGKLMLTSEGEHVSVDIDTVDSASFAVEFEFSMSNASPEGHCVVYARNEGSGESHRHTAIGFFSNGTSSFALSAQEGSQEDVAYGEFDTTVTNKVTMVVIRDQLAVLMNDQPFYSVRDPYKGAVYTNTSFAATYAITCEYDNYKYWDLSGVGIEEQTTESGFSDKALSYLKTAAPAFKDDFSTDAHSWEWGNTSEGMRVISDYRDRERGLLSITDDVGEDPVFGNYRPPGFSFPTNGLIDARDFAFQFDFRFGGLDGIGARFRSTQAQNIYYEIMVDSSGSWQLIEEPGEILISEGSEQYSSDFYTLLIIAQNENLAIYLEDELIFETDEMALVGSSIRIIATGSSHGAIGEFDNVKLWNLEGVNFSTSTETTTPAPTTSASQGPAWVTEFAEPVLAYISDRPPDIQDQFQSSSDAWQIGHRDVTIWQKSTENGEMLLRGVQAQNKSIVFHDYVAEITIRPPRGTQTTSYGITFSNGTGDFSAISIQTCGFYITNDWFDSKCMGKIFSGNIKVQTSLKFQLIIKGGRIAIYINDEPMVYYEDDRYRLYRGDAPQFYLETGDATIAFSNFKVWNITRIEVP